MSSWIKYIFILLTICPFGINAQNNASIYGYVTNDASNPLELVNISIIGKSGGTSSAANGFYELYIPSDTNVTIAFSILGYVVEYFPLKLAKNERRELNVTLIDKSVNLQAVEVRDKYEMAGGIIRLDPRKSELLPTYGGLEAFIKLIGLGVSSGNELSSSYNVRGGNFDENLVYANDIEIYRPFLVRSGQQEGLSFLNSDLVSSVSFSSGGFEPRYGDKLSSVLDVQYKRPDSLRGHVQASLLGANAHIEGTSKNTLFTYLAGIRYKSNQYVLNAMDTKGEYKPSFTDFQTYLTWQLSETSEINLLGYYSSNRYRLVPETRETSYGTVNEAYRLTIYFDGEESDYFSTILGGLRYVHRPNDNLMLKYVVSAHSSDENENYDIQGQYWIGMLENSMGDEEFGEVKENLGVGTYLDHARNSLKINVMSVEHKGLFDKGKYYLQWGVKAQREMISDKIWEWKYIDSSGFSLPHTPDSVGYSNPNVQNNNTLSLSEILVTKMTLNTMRYSGFVQNGWEWIVDSARINILGGFRFSYWDFNKEMLFSPRVSVSFLPNWDKKILFRLATGLYQQPPFYRELRDMDGNLHPNVKAQKSIHYVAGMEYDFKAWKRPFRLVAEAYYKSLYDLVPYVVDNVRVRYLPEYSSKGYATGLDIKLNGEFVKDAESWISIGVLKTQEDILNDYYYKYFNSEGEEIIPGYTVNTIAVDSTRFEPGYIRRPTDQRVNVSLFFQDYLPRNPSFKMHLSLVFGTRLPFGPPGSEKYKQTLKIPPYKRVDIGFSKQFIGYKNPNKKIRERRNLKFIKNAWVSAEVFNLLQNNNVISYIWVTDVNNRQYAVPNYLTPRQLNVKLLFQF